MCISNSPKLLEFICEDQVGTVGTCAVVEDTESYAKTTVNHLELATDLSVDVFIRCLTRFAARRGLPELIITDNAKTFKAIDKNFEQVIFLPKSQEIPGQ